MRKFFVLIFALTVFASIETKAQFTDFKSVYNLALDTVTNTATVYVTSPALSSTPATSTTIWVKVTKISGTVGGTITLQGSPDNSQWKALNTVGTQTALATVTATDASNTYHWILQGSPFPYYRVSWTGTGTMSASFQASVYRSR